MSMMNKVIKVLFEKHFPGQDFTVMPVSQKYKDEDVAEQFIVFSKGVEVGTELRTIALTMQ